MIARADTPRRRARYRKVCRGKLCLGALLPLELALFGRSQPGRFFAGPSLALELNGAAAWAAGGANPEELAGFLAFCGVRELVTDGAAPAGWRAESPLTIFSLAPGAALPLPPADPALWASLRLDLEPPAGPVAAALFPDCPARWEDFYSELCTRRNHGAARVWALWQGETLACTVGAYALCAGQAYLACGQTAEPLRGRGVGGRLIVQCANELAAAGLQVCFLAGPERVRFYTRLGFAPGGTVYRYTAP